MPGPMPGSGKTENQAATEENPSRRAGQRTARTRSASATLPTPVSQQRATSRCTTLNDPEDQTTRCDKPAAHGQPEPDRCWEHHRQCGEHCKKYKEAQEEADRVLEGKRLPNEADIARYTSRKETTKDMEWVSKYSEAIGTEMTERVIHSKRFFLKPDKGHQTRINRLKEEKENADWVIGKLQERHQKLERIALLEGARKSKKDLEDAILKVEEDATAQVSKTAKSMISQAIECIGRGKLGGDVPCIPLPTYPGLSGAWNYAREIRLALLASVDAAVRGAEEEAVMIAKIGMERIKELADKHLPPGIERNTRHLQAPSTMFSGSGSHSRLLGQRPDLTEPTVFDLFDVNHQLSEHSNDGKANSEDPGATEPNALTLAIVGFGALTMVRGWAPGRAILRSIVRVANLFSKGTLRNCAALIIGAIWLRATTYHILDFPSTIPRTVGRRLKWSFVQGHGRVSFVDAHVTRVGKETRSFLQHGGRDLMQRLERYIRQLEGGEERRGSGKKAEQGSATGIGIQHQGESICRCSECWPSLPYTGGRRTFGGQSSSTTYADHAGGRRTFGGQSSSTTYTGGRRTFGGQTSSTTHGGGRRTLGYQSSSTTYSGGRNTLIAD